MPPATKDLAMDDHDGRGMGVNSGLLAAPGWAPSWGMRPRWADSAPRAVPGMTLASAIAAVLGEAAEDWWWLRVAWAMSAYCIKRHYGTTPICKPFAWCAATLVSFVGPEIAGNSHTGVGRDVAMNFGTAVAAATKACVACDYKAYKTIVLIISNAYTSMSAIGDC